MRDFYLVQVEIRGNSASKLYIYREVIVGNNGDGDYTINEDIYFDGKYYARKGILLPLVFESNLEIKILASATGDEDGEEITSATTIAAIMTNSHTSCNGVGGNYLPICLRCEEGFKAIDVCIEGGTKVGYLNATYGCNGSTQGFVTWESFKATLEDSKCRFIRNAMYSIAKEEAV